MTTDRKHDDPYLSVAGAARQLGVSRPTVMAWAAKGDLVMEVLAGRHVIRRDSVDAYLAMREAAVAVA